jgi:hypothetical protein
MKKFLCQGVDCPEYVDPVSVQRGAPAHDRMNFLSFDHTLQTKAPRVK